MYPSSTPAAASDSMSSSSDDVDRGAATVESPAPNSPTVACAPAPAAAPSGDTIDYCRPGTGELVGLAAAVSTSPEPCPTTVAGYEILGVLGRGAMGVVYKARQPGLKRTVALKMILAGGHASAHELARFRGEAEAVAQLHHPHIVQIYEVGAEGGLPFFSLEFVDGPPLDKKLQGDPLPPRAAARLAEQLAEAMDYAHKRGIVHRDLKPANVLMTADGSPKIGDFGLAKRIEGGAGQTHTGAVLGTPSYMAPEQAEGRLADVGPLSDVYSLGAILYDLLTGRAPFKGTSVLETLDQVRTREPVAPVQLQPGIPRDLETICLKCLQKDPGRRYASAGALAADLDRFQKGEPILARPIGRLERTWRWCQRNPRIAGLTATIVLAVVAWGLTASLMAWQIKLQKDEADRQTLLAVANEREAQKQTLLAVANEREAKKQAGIAFQSEGRAKKTASGAVRQMVRLGEMLDQRLRNRLLSVQASPAVRQLRADVLAALRIALTTLSQEIEAIGATPNSQVASCQALGDLSARLGQGREALQLYQRGFELAKKLADARPNDDVARANLGLMLARLGTVSLDLNGDARAARDYFIKARDLHRDVRAHPRTKYYTQIDMKRILSHDDIHLGRALLTLGHPAQARVSFQEALAYRQAWSTAEPKRIDARSYVMEAHMWLGAVACRLADAKAAEEHFAKALGIGADLTRQFPTDISFQGDVAEARGAYGDSLAQLGQIDKARANYEKSLRRLQVVVAKNPDDIAKQSLLALAHERLGALEAGLKKGAAADNHYQDALRLRTELLQIETTDLARQAAFLLALARAGKPADAAALAGKLRPKVAKSTELLLQIARCFAVCATADTPQRAKYEEAALDALRAGTQADYQDAVVLRTDADLTALRGRPVFEKLVAEVKAR